MTDNHPITPPLSLINQWWDEAKQNAKYDEPIGPLVATQAAQWGADQELESCCEWFQEFYKTESWVNHDLKHFRAARRPNPPTLKKQALDSLQKIEDNNATYLDSSIVRRALEALPE
jgi:hypothetical protein